MRRRQDIHDFLHPDGVAMIGGINRDSSEDAVRRQYDPLFGADNWYLVSPRGGSIGAVPIYASLADLPRRVDLVVLSTPPATTAEVIDECGAQGVRFAVVFTSGFAEVGGDGIEYERELAAAGRRNNIRILGPNTNTNAFELIPQHPHASGGGIVMVSQSGHTGRPVVQGTVRGSRFLRQIPCGNEADLDVCDFIEYLADDPDTAVIAGYIEGFRNIEKLRRALDAARDAGKPVILLKIGSTEAGRQMASSHTGHLAGSDRVLNGLFRQYGVVRVHDLDELIETASLFARLPATAGAGIGMYSISGGSIALMAEHAATNGLPIPTLSEQTQAELATMLPSYLRMSNPVDNGGRFIISGTPRERRKLLDAIAADPAIDIIVIGLTGQVSPMTDNLSDDLAQMANSEFGKPVVVTWNSPLIDDDGYRKVIQSGYPVFASFRNCFKALAAHSAWRAGATRERGKIVTVELTADQLQSLHAAQGAIGPPFADQLLVTAGLPLSRAQLATSPEQAVSAADLIGYPVVMKISSADIPHKSDLGLVHTGVTTSGAAAEVYDALIDRTQKAQASARIDGVIVQETIGDAVEMIVGVIDDPTVGLAVLVGMGGIFAEVYADVSVRPLPIDEHDAREMIASLRGYPLLTGVRGRAPADVDGLVAVVQRTAALAQAAAGALVEVDLNPVMVRPDGCIIVDTLLIARAAVAGTG